MTGIIGNTISKFIPRDKTDQQIVESGKNYFIVKIHTAQASFTAPFYQKINRLIVTSKIVLNHPILGTKPINALQFSREVEKNTPQKLGTTKNLINFVPAIMETVSISLDFLLDTHNRFASLAKLINAGAFVTEISLGAGAAATAKTVSDISQKLVDTFIPDPKQRTPILQFTGDFNIPTKELSNGYYVILGTRNKEKPLPSASSKFEVKGDSLFVDGIQATAWSYVILSVFSIDARGRSLSEGAVWEKKLREAEGRADVIEFDPLASEDDKKEEWKKCRGLIGEAMILLNNDINYLHDEAKNIYVNVAKYCNIKIFGKKTRLIPASAASISEETRQDREFLGIPLDEDIEISLNRYNRQVEETNLLIQKEKLL